MLKAAKEEMEATCARVGCRFCVSLVKDAGSSLWTRVKLDEHTCKVSKKNWIWFGKIFFRRMIKHFGVVVCELRRISQQNTMTIALF